MLRRIVRISAPVTFILPAGFAWLFGGCNGRDLTVAKTDPPETPSFGAPDADVGNDAGEREPVSYCPSNKCPAGSTTCPNSRFPCDVNLLSDVDNCGACGSACPATGFNSAYSCINGQCTAQCSAGALDCDGLPDNGCEASVHHDDHCGACNKQCTDPEKPCVVQDVVKQTVGCGCPGGQIVCNGGRCVDATIDDNNCGTCGHACSPTLGGDPAPTNAYYGCGDSACGKLKCQGEFGNCDGDESNGCETSILTPENCGGCGVACAPGQACRLDDYGTPQCMCGAGLTLCDSNCNNGACHGTCVDIVSDRSNCGGCDQACPQAPYANYVCNYGTCVPLCADDHADCNNSVADGCEVNIGSDPRNCGGCGKTCDAVAGQACVAGRCVVEPCATGDAGVAR